ncbi:hypothetical protein OMP38_31330 [Cohnella ginsengisoli]|uniref:Uncharacterized protein n=1 Tax=Cohnella ginsengisoli TaxID=425004 RepID=A0A9X4KN60_9BACL|nr:hypothetical protein [Cohnella ginsengisoli]MDG0794821.1 hypothetical protein [Cohnella ginsengisoli]
MAAGWAPILADERVNVMRVIPASRSKQWLSWGAMSWLVTTLLFWLVRFVILGQPWTAVHAFRFLLVALAVSAFAAISGWLGARWLALSTLAGNLLGLLIMAFVSRGNTGWEDLSSLLVYLELLGLGLAVGVVLELMLLFTIRKGSRHGR